MNAYDAPALSEENKDEGKMTFRRRRSLLTVTPHDIPYYKSTELIEIRKSFQLTQPEFSKVLGVAPSTYKKWEIEQSPIPRSIQHFLYLIETDRSIIEKFVTITQNKEL